MKTHILALLDPIFIVLKAETHQFDATINARGSRSPLGNFYFSFYAVQHKWFKNYEIAIFGKFYMPMKNHILALPDPILII